MKAVGTAAVVTTLAGCGSGGGGSGGGGGNGGGGGDGGGVSDVSEWEAVTEIELGGQTGGWLGQEPSQIEEEQNPTLVLFEGEEYTVMWENLDGEQHNFALLNENGEVIHATELMGEEGATQTYDFEATNAMAQYVCQPHENTMQGDIQIESDGSGGAESESAGNESAGNESTGNESTGNESAGNESA